MGSLYTKLLKEKNLMECKYPAQRLKPPGGGPSQAPILRPSRPVQMRPGQLVDTPIGTGPKGLMGI